MEEKRAQKLQDLIEFAKECRASRKPFVFRGQRDSAHDLVPGVFREGYWFVGDEERSTAQEKMLYHSFQAWAPSRTRSCPDKSDRLAWLTIMQHYRLPTRLLDWTTSMGVAAYFACQPKKDKNGNKLDGRVWAYGPPHFVILTSELLAKAAEDAASGIHGSYYYPFIPEQIDLRMYAQHSAFTIHGCEAPLTASDERKDTLKSIVIPEECKRRIREEFRHLGICKASLFPDLESMAEGIVELVRERAQQ